MQAGGPRKVASIFFSFGEVCAAGTHVQRIGAGRLPIKRASHPGTLRPAVMSTKVAPEPTVASGGAARGEPTTHHAVWGLTSGRRTCCSLHAVLCVLQQWVRELIYIVVGLCWMLCRCKSKDCRSGGKRVCFIRHGQGQHNTSMLEWAIVDPPLNSTGEEQVKALHSTLRDALPSFDLVAVSPLTRAMQTALGVFDGTCVPFHVLPLLRERMGAPCDRGRPKRALLKAMPQLAGWDGIEELPEIWWSTQWVELDLFSRVESLEQWIYARPERTIALVGHGGLFMRLLGTHLKNCGHVWQEWGTAAGAGSGAERLRAATRAVTRKQRAVSRFVVWGGG